MEGSGKAQTGTSDSPDVPGPPTGSVKRQVFMLAAGLIAAAGCVVAFSLAYLHREALQAGESLTESLAHIVEEQTSRTLQAADQRLQLVATRLQALEASRNLTEEAARTMLRQQLDGLPFVRAFYVLDARGRIVFDSDVGNIGLAQADREYFRIYQDRPATGFHVSAPARSRTGGNWLLAASRPLRDGAGKLTGVIVAAIEPSYFDQLWNEIHLSAGGAISLFRTDSVLMMRSPRNDAAMGQAFPQLSLFQKPLATRQHDTYRTTSVIDGQDRIASYRLLSGYPELLIVVARSYGDILGPWSRFALLASAIWLVASAVVAGLAALLYRQLRSQQQSDLRFRQLSQAMPQIVFISDGQGKILFINDQWTEITGEPVQAVLDRGWTDRVHPDDRGYTARNYKEMIRTGAVVPSEYRLRCRDDVYRWQLARAKPYRDQQGNIVSWYGTSTDINDMKVAEAALKNQADMMRMAGQISRVGGWVLEVPAMRMVWSDEAAAVLGLDTGADLTLDQSLELCDAPSRELAATAVRQCLESGTQFDVEVRLRTADGRDIWVRSIGLPVRDDAGRITGINGALQDITERRLATQALQTIATENASLLAQVRELNSGLEEKIALRTAELARQEALFRALAEEAPQPIWTVDPRGHVTFLSRAWYQMTGGSPPEWLGDEWVRLVHPDDVPTMSRNWQRCRETGELFTGTRRIRAHDGTFRTSQYRASPVRNEQGEVMFWVGVDADITDIMKIEEALRLSNEELKAFSYSISHDLRSPLTTIDGFSRLLATELGQAAPPKAMSYLSRIQASAHQMGQLIEGLLTLAQLSRIELQRKGVDLSAIAQEILERLQSAEAQRAAVIHVQRNLVVQADTFLMRSVMENLLGNAWKFTSRKAQTAISVGFSEEAQAFFVRDNGAGFDMAYADQLFGPFQRLHPAGDYPGTGIGLATVSRVITRHGGHIWAESLEGQGSTFFFTVPHPAS